MLPACSKHLVGLYKILCKIMAIAKELKKARPPAPSPHQTKFLFAGRTGTVVFAPLLHFIVYTVQ